MFLINVPEPAVALFPSELKIVIADFLPKQNTPIVYWRHLHFCFEEDTVQLGLLSNAERKCLKNLFCQQILFTVHMFCFLQPLKVDLDKETIVQPIGKF